MSDLPSPHTLATLVSGVTETMFGMSFTLSEWPAAMPTAPTDERRSTVVLPIGGGRPLTVALSCDWESGVALGGAMFSCAAGEVDAPMIKDSMSELVNIIAGQVKSAMGLDQALGLPRELKGGPADPGASWRGATLKHQGREVSVWVAIAEKQL